MKRILHHLGKDVRHHRRLLAAWLLLLVMDVALSPAFPWARLSEAGALAFLSPLRSFVLLAFAGIHACLLVFTDGPLDDREAWRTRPLDGRTIAAAKILYLALFHLLLPFGFDAVKLAAAGAAGSIVPAGIEQSFYRGAVVAFFAGLGALVRRPAMVMAGVALIWLTGVAIIVLSFVLRRGVVDSAAFLNGSNIVVACAAMAVGGLISLMLVYDGRRIRAAGIVFGVATLAAQVVPIFQLVRIPLAGMASDHLADAIRVEIDPASLHPGIEEDFFTGGTRVMLFARLEVEGADGMQAVHPLRIEARLTGADGATARSALDPSAGPLVSEVPANFHAVLGCDEVFRQDFSRPRLVMPVLEGAKDSLGRALSSPSRLEWRATLAAFRLEDVAELPLTPGETWEDQGDRVELVNVLRDHHRISLYLEERFRSLLFDFDSPVPHTPEAPWHYALVNRARGQAIVLTRAGMLTSVDPAGLSPLRRRAPTMTVDLSALHHASGGTDTDPEAWLDGASLHIVRVRLAGFLEKSGSVPDVADHLVLD